jgi:hypothetical protein
MSFPQTPVRSLYEVSNDALQQADDLDFRTEAFISRGLDRQERLFQLHVRETMDQFRDEMKAMLAANLSSMNTRVDALTHLTMQQHNDTDDDMDVEEGFIPRPANRNAQIAALHQLVKTRWNKNKDGITRDEIQLNTVCKRLTKCANGVINEMEANLYKDGIKRWKNLSDRLKSILIRTLEKVVKQSLNVKLSECEDSWGARELLSKCHHNLSRPSRSKKAATATTTPTTAPTTLTTTATTMAASSTPTVASSTVSTLLID